MLKIHQKVFLIVFYGLLLLPLGYVCGIKDTTLIYGVLPQYNLPSLQEQHFGNREFQSAFERYWTGHFLYHNAALKIKNQLYDWLNFGKVHSGYSGAIIEGKKGWLFLKEYFNSYAQKCQSLPAEKINRFAELVKIAQKHGKSVYFVLAPNKAVTYPQYLPERYKYFLGDDCGYYEKIENIMKEQGIPVFNVQKFYRKRQFTKETEPFSRTGIHWNHYGAGIAAAEAAKTFGWGNISVGKIEERNMPWTTERDIANLLNRYIPKNRYDLFYRPELSANTVWQGKTAVIGNSFSNEFLIALTNSGMLAQNEFFHYENRPLTAEQAQNVWKANRWIFVYTDIAVMNNVDQMYAKAEMLMSMIPGNYVFSVADDRLKISGVSSVENWGRWIDSENSSLELNYDSSGKNVVAAFSVNPFISEKHKRQDVTVRVNGQKLEKWHFVYGKPYPETKIVIPAELLKNKKIRFDFYIPTLESPKNLGINGDTRRLGIGLKSLHISEQE